MLAEISPPEEGIEKARQRQTLPPTGIETLAHYVDDYNYLRGTSLLTYCYRSAYQRT